MSARQWGVRNNADCAHKMAFTRWSQALHGAHYSQQHAGGGGVIFRPYRGKCCGMVHVGASLRHRSDSNRRSVRHDACEIDDRALREIRTLSDAIALDGI